MKISLVAGEPNGQVCADCSVRQFNVCAVLDRSEQRELEQLGRHAHFTSSETVFAQEELMTSVYNLLEGVMRLYKLLPDGRRQIVGFVSICWSAQSRAMLGSTRHGRLLAAADRNGLILLSFLQSADNPSLCQNSNWRTRSNYSIQAPNRRAANVERDLSHIANPGPSL